MAGYPKLTLIAEPGPDEAGPGIGPPVPEMGDMQDDQAKLMDILAQHARGIGRFQPHTQRKGAREKASPLCQEALKRDDDGGLRKRLVVSEGYKALIDHAAALNEHRGGP